MSDNLRSVSRSFDLQTHSIYSKQLGHKRWGRMSHWLQLKRKLVPSDGNGRMRRKFGTPVGTQTSALICRTPAIRWSFARLLNACLNILGACYTVELCTAVDLLLEVGRTLPQLCNADNKALTKNVEISVKLIQQSYECG